jgi:hypothetical protein
VLRAVAHSFPDALASRGALLRLEALLEPQRDAALAVDLLAAATECAAPDDLPAAARKRLARALEPLAAQPSHATAATTALCRLARLADDADARLQQLADRRRRCCRRPPPLPTTRRRSAPRCAPARRWRASSRSCSSRAAPRR